MPIIKILKKGLKKAQVGTQAPPGPIFFKSPKIVTDDMLPPDDPEAREQEQRQKDKEAAYRLKYPNAPVDNTGVFDMRDPFQKQYDNNPDYAGRFDTSILSNAMLNGSRSDAKAQAKFFNDKYKTNYKAPLLGAKPRKALFKTADAINIGTGVIGAGVGLIDNAKKQKYFNSYMRNSMMPDNMYDITSASETDNRGDYDINNGILRPNQLGFKSKGMYTNSFTGPQNFAQMGGSMIRDIDGNLTIKILDEPQKMAYGGQLGFGLDLGRTKAYTEMLQSPYDNVSNTISEDEDSDAPPVLEAEGGETILHPDGTHFKIEGDRHVDGGVELTEEQAPEGSFIYSDTKKMTIKDAEILKRFGMSESKAGYTPAEIAKKYDTNKFKALMDDPNTDRLTKETAQLMVKNYKKKLGELALIQESMKGLPDGPPQVAIDAGVVPEELMAGKAETPGLEADSQQMPSAPQEQLQEPMEGQGQEQMMDAQQGEQEEQQAAYGGLTHYQSKGQVTPPVKTLPTYQPTFRDILDQLAKQNYKVSTPSLDYEENMPATQHSTIPGVYGTKNWADTAHMADFARRHPEFIAANPNWDPTKKGATRAFQQWYTKNVDPNYFSGVAGKTPYAEDDWYGQHTWSAPGKSREKIPPPPIPVPTPIPGFKCINGVVVSSTYPNVQAAIADGAFQSDTEARAQCTQPGTTYIPPRKNTPPPFGFMAPDVTTMLAASLVPPKKRLPWEGKLINDPGRVLFEDWRGKAAARQSIFNNASNQIGTYQSGPGAVANTTFLAGQQMQGLSEQDIQPTDVRNVGTANAYSQNEAQRKDRVNLYNVMANNELFKGNTIAGEQYDNSLRKYIGNNTRAYNNAWNNRMNLGMINAVNPVYNVDPRTGRSYFRQGYDPSRLAYASGQGSSFDWANAGRGYATAQGYMPGLSAAEYLKYNNPRSTSVDSNGDGLPDRTNYSNYQMQQAQGMIPAYGMFQRGLGPDDI